MSINLNYISSLIAENTKSIEQYTFSSNPPSSLKLADQIVLYNLDDQWKIVPLLYMLTYPIIYDNDSTLVVCPITLRCGLFKGHLIFDKYNKYNMILKEKESNNIITLETGSVNPELNKRSEVKIATFRSSLMIAPDPHFIDIKNTKPLVSIMDISYYSNESDIDNNEIYTSIHPKTLIYVIQYKSFKTGKEKVSLVLGKDIEKSYITGYDLRKSGLLEYLSKYQQKIINKEGYTMPMLWYLAKEVYGSYAKVVYLY